MKLNYDAIIFDLDGTLIDNVDIKIEGNIKLFEQYGKDIIKQVTDYIHQNAGRPRSEHLRHIYTQILHETLTDEKMEKLCMMYSAFTLKPSIEAPWIKGAKEFLEKHYKQNNFYVISAVENDDLKLIIKKRNMNKYFRCVHGSPPDKFINLTNVVSSNYYNPNKTLYIGDLLSDLDAAKAVGTEFVGVAKTPTFPSTVKVIKDFINGVPDAI